MQWGDAAALVTGGASGLGRAAATALAGTGARVVIADLTQSDGEVVAKSLGDRAVFVPCDVTDPDQVQAAVDAAEGRLRVAVCCAGVATPGRIIGKRGALSTADFARVVEINLVGTFTTLSLAAQAMSTQDPVDGDRGVIVCTASIAAYDGQIGQAAYAASKGGIASLTLSAARDLADRAIRVMTIAPGVMETPMMAGLPEQTRTTLESLVPHPSRLGRPEEYAMLVSAIIANPLLNGEVIRLDGALRMPPR